MTSEHMDEWPEEEADNEIADAAADMLTLYPDDMVSHVKIWTPSRGTIESAGHHDALVGRLLSVLISRTSPRNEVEAAAMHDLLVAMEIS